MGNKIKLYIVDIEDSIIDRLEELFYNNPNLGIKVIGSSHNYNSCLNDLSRARDADVFLISAYLPDTMGYELIEPIKKVAPESKILMTLSNNTRNLDDVCKTKGANEVILKPFKANSLIDNIEKLVHGEDNDDYEEEKEMETSNKSFKIDNYSKSSNDNDEESINDANEPIQNEMNDDELFNSTDDEVDSNPNKRALFDVYSDNPITSSIYNDEEEFEGEKPNVVCVFSSTSSAGKTTMLVNTALAIKKFSDYDPKICIVDFNLLFPSVLYKFHHDDLILCKKNIYDVCEDINSLSEKLIEQALVTHEPTGVKILDTPSDVIRDLSRINSETIEQLIAQLREMFDLVLIDTSSNIRDDSSSFPLTIADKGLVFLEPDMSSLLHTRKFISMMRIFEKNLDEDILSKVHFILNKENPKTFIHTDTIKKTLFNTNVRITIPEDTNITDFSNNGRFIVDTTSPTVRHVKELSRLIYPFDRELSIDRNKNKNNKNSGLLGNLFNKKKK